MCNKGRLSSSHSLSPTFSSLVILLLRSLSSGQSLKIHEMFKDLALSHVLLLFYYVVPVVLKPSTPCLLFLTYGSCPPVYESPHYFHCYYTTFSHFSLVSSYIFDNMPLSLSLCLSISICVYICSLVSSTSTLMTTTKAFSSHGHIVEHTRAINSIDKKQ